MIVEFPKGTLVRVRTSNGGETVAALWFDYRRTYDASLNINGHCVVIPAFRLTTVEKV